MSRPANAALRRGRHRLRHAVAWAQGNPGQFAGMITFMALPSAFCAMLAPGWTSFAAAALLLPAAVGVLLCGPVADACGGKAGARDAADPPLPPQGVVERLVGAMSEHVGRWSATSEASGTRLTLARDEVAEVMADIHVAAMTIGSSFRGIMKKTAMQTECVVRVLDAAGSTDRLGHSARAAMHDIGELGKEIREDVGRIIVAMQFEDITQQKLERVHQPALKRVIQELRTVAAESCQLREEAHQLIGPGAGGRSDCRGQSAAWTAVPRTTEETRAAAHAARRSPDVRAGGNDVELF
jgi:hypothetical protein